MTIRSIFLLLTLFHCLACNSQSKTDWNGKNISKENIIKSLPKEYNWYVKDSLHNPNSGFIVKGDSIKMDFHFNSLIPGELLSNEKKARTDTILGEFLYTTLSKETLNNKFSFIGFLYRIGENDNEIINDFKECLVLFQTNRNVHLNSEEIEKFRNYFDRFNVND